MHSLYNIAQTMHNIYAGIAQLVEQLIRNEQVAGSSPITSSIEMEISLTVIIVRDIFF